MTKVKKEKVTPRDTIHYLKMKKDNQATTKGFVFIVFHLVGNHCHIKIGRIVVCINNISANTRSTYFARENFEQAVFFIIYFYYQYCIGFGKNIHVQLIDTEIWFSIFVLIFMFIKKITNLLLKKGNQL